jgi:hypothetical protein
MRAYRIVIPADCTASKKPTVTMLAIAAAVAATAAPGCADEAIVFTTPGRSPPDSGDLVIEVDGVSRGFGKARLAKDANGKPIILAEISEFAISATIRIPEIASTVSCVEQPKAIVLTTSSPLEHSNSSYNVASWSASECTITVSRIDALAKQGAEGSFSAALVRDQDEVGGRMIDGPKRLSVKGTFVASADP